MLKKVILLVSSVLLVSSSLLFSDTSITILTPRAVSNVVSGVIVAGSGVSLSTNTNTLQLTITSSGGTNGAGAITNINGSNGILVTNGIAPFCNLGLDTNLLKNTIGGIPLLNGVGTNLTLNGLGKADVLTVYPTNVTAGVGTIAAASGAKVWTLAGGGTTTGWHEGWNFLISTEQYRVDHIVDSTHVWAENVPGCGGSQSDHSSGASYSISPNAVSFADTTGRIVASIGNDGTLDILQEVFNSNSGAIHFSAGTNGFYIGEGTGTYGNMFTILPDIQKNKCPFRIYEGSASSPDNSFEILPDGYISFATGITNARSSFLSVPIQVNGKVVNLAGASSVSGTGTLSGTINQHIFTIASGNTTQLNIGSQLTITNDIYVIDGVINSTQFNVFQSITKTYTSATVWSITAPAFATSNNTPVISFTVSSDGSPGVNGQTSSGVYYLFNGTNTWCWGVGSDSFGNLMGFTSPLVPGISGTPFVIYNTAPYDSFHIMPDGTIAVKYAITNFTGGNVIIGNIAQANKGVESLLSNTLSPVSITFPLTTVNWTNTTGYNIEVYVDNAGVTGTVVKKNNVQIFSSLVGDMTFHLQNNEYFSETYTIGTPSAKYSPF